MRIGIAYDTKETYLNEDGNQYRYDFSSESNVMFIKRALEDRGYETVLLGNAQEILKLLKDDGTLNCDLVFNHSEGFASRNREGWVPSLLETAGMPFVGTDAYGLSLTLDKYTSKLLAAENGIRTPKGCLIHIDDSDDCIDEKIKELRLPVIVKPNDEGNSTGVFRCMDYPSAKEAVLKNIENFHSPVVCEEFISGAEITVPVIRDINGNDLLCGATGIDLQNGDGDFWMDTDFKLKTNYENTIIDDPSGQRLKQYKHAADTMFEALGCSDYARFDFRESPDGTIYFIETNPIPSLFAGGTFSVVGRRQGLSDSEMVELIVKTACKRLNLSLPISKLG